MSDPSEKLKLQAVPQEKKKRPGRPRKKPPKEELEKLGIIKEPTSPKNVMEMVYDNPGIFKKLFAMFKHMDAKEELHVWFRQSCVKIITKDKFQANHIDITIDAKKLNMYYCGEELDICFSPGEMETILQAVDKDVHSISFCCTEERKRSELITILNNYEVNTQAIYRTKTYTQPKYEDWKEQNVNLAEYPIRFTIPTKYFRKMITDISQISNTFSIEKEPRKPLRISYTNNKKIKAEIQFKEEKKIKLVCKLKANQIFKVSFKSEYVKQISNTLICDHIEIYAHTDKPLVSRLLTPDELLDIRIYTEYVDHRKADY